MSALELLDIAAFGAALGCALMAGLFFAFSVAGMKALGALPPAQGIAAMQSINVAIVNRWFLLVFFGTGVASSRRFSGGVWRAAASPSWGRCSISSERCA